MVRLPAYQNIEHQGGVQGYYIKLGLIERSMKEKTRKRENIRLYLKS